VTTCITRSCRLDLIRAVEGDDWSSVIDGQTAETVVQPAEPAAASAPSPINSPFTRANVHRSIGDRENRIGLVHQAVVASQCHVQAAVGASSRMCAAAALSLQC